MHANGRDYVFSRDDLRGGKGDGALAVDRAVAKLCEERPLGIAVAQLSGHGFELRMSMGRHGVRLHHGARVVALISATRATFRSNHRGIEGNFLIAGEHWDAVRAALPKPSPRRAGERPRGPGAAAQTLLTALPDAIGADQRAAATEAIDRIRRERSLEFGQPVVLQLTERSIRFTPIDENAPVAEVPFTYRKGDEILRGALRLKTPSGPLALAVPEGGPPALLAEAWVTALLGYAELTCVKQPPAPEVEARPSGDGRTRDQRRGTPAVRRAVPREGAGGRPRLSSALDPTSDTQALLASYVVGHRRRLAAGRRASDDARRRAARLGITLGERETWVRPHARGIPQSAELVFDWRTAR